MNEVFIYISLAFVLLMFIFSSILYKCFKIWKLILLIITAGCFTLLTYFQELITFVSIELALEYYTYFLFLMVAVFGITFKNKIRITRNLTDYDFFELEKELEEVNSTSDLLRLRFISTIGLLNDGLIFYNDDLEGMFITEQARDMISASECDIDMNEYVRHIHKDDQSEYNNVIKKVNRKNPNYEIKYRVLNNSTFSWVVEKGQY